MLQDGIKELSRNLMEVFQRDVILTQKHFTDGSPGRRDDDTASGGTEELVQLSKAHDHPIAQHG